MNPRQKADIVEEAARWLEAAGHREGLSALTAGLHDIFDSAQEVFGSLLPALARLRPAERQKALDILVELLSHLDHIASHVADARAALLAARDSLDDSPGPPET